MGWEQERKQYISKLRRITEGIDKILKLPPNRIINSEIRPKLDKLYINANALLKKLDKGEFEIAVVGMEKAGKSSFANALINLDTLPTDDKRCTYTSTCIRPGDHNHAEIAFYTEAELNSDLRNKLEILGIPDFQAYSLDNLDLARYEHLYNKCSAEKKQLYGDSINEDIRELLANKDSLRKYLHGGTRNFTEEELNASDFKGFITEPSKAMAVKEVVIYSTSLSSMPNAVLYDVPGFDSPTDMHKKQTLEKMSSADAIIAVANAKNPSLTQPSLEIFRKSDQDGCLMNEKLFIFANKADWVEDKEQLRKNMDETRHEWIVKRHILPSQFADRIIPGSAYAALGNDKAKMHLAELGITDGIEEIKTSLDQYNRSERFNVLKKRIEKFLFDLESIFEPSRKIKTDLNIDGLTLYGKLLLDLMAKLKPVLENGLDDLKAKLTSELRQEKPLSKDIKDRLNNLVLETRYGINKEELERTHRKVAGIGGAEQPEKVDGLLRESRFEKMYGDFCAEIQDSAIEKHRNVTDEVIDVFLSAMNVSSEQEGYDTLKNNIVEFCALNPGSDAGYYRSLLERFARDLFEILIMFGHGRDRLNKFEEEESNFFSMGVFFDADANPSHKGLPVNPQDSIFWKILLYPELAEMPDAGELEEMVKKAMDIETLEPDVKTLLTKVAVRKGLDAGRILIERMQGMPKGRNETAINRDLRNMLEELLDEDSNTEDIGKIYLENVYKRHSDYNYEKVKDEFNKDIQGLRRVLTGAFIPAVNMDKAFAARETRKLEELSQKLDSEDFRIFLSNNIGIIEAARLGQIRAEEAQRKADAAAMREVATILDGIGSETD